MSQITALLNYETRNRAGREMAVFCFNFFFRPAGNAQLLRRRPKPFTRTLFHHASDLRSEKRPTNGVENHMSVGNAETVITGSWHAAILSTRTSGIPPERIYGFRSWLLHGRKEIPKLERERRKSGQVADWFAPLSTFPPSISLWQFDVETRTNQSATRLRSFTSS